MVSLWALDEALQHMVDQATDHITGEINEELLWEIESLELDREKKLLAIAGFIKGERLEAMAVKTQAGLLVKRAEGHEGRAKRLESYMLRSLHEGETMRDDRNWIKWRKSTAVIVDDMAQLEVEYVVHPPAPEPRPDKAGLAKALKVGDVSGAHLEHRMKLVLD